jgi:hypothetical protein
MHQPVVEREQQRITRRQSSSPIRWTSVSERSVQCRLDLKTRQNIPLRAQLPLPLRRHILLQVMTRARKLGRKEFSTNQALIFKKKISLWDWHFFSCIHDEDRGVHGIEASEIVF